MLHLAIDSGGTKTQGLVYDDAFRPVRAFRVGSTRPNSTPPQAVAENARALMCGLFGEEKPVLGTVCGIFYPEMRSVLESACTVEQFLRVGELPAGLSAGGVFGDGVLALSGTGCSIFARIGGETYAAGGFGSMVDDEGSGYWMGRKAMQAAIRDFEGRGEHTALTGLFCEKFQKSDLRSAVFSVYSGAGDTPSTVVTGVAACAPLVCRAAEEGDAAALGIVSRAGDAIGETTAALIRKYAIASHVPVVLSGSVWKGHPAIYQRFASHLPGRRILRPTYEPIAGMVLCHAREDGVALDETQFRKAYHDYLY